MNHNTNLHWVLHNLEILSDTNKPLIVYLNARLDNTSNTLSRIIANLANRQQRFQTYIPAFSRQLLQQQIATTKRSIENRKPILNKNLIKQTFTKWIKKQPCIIKKQSPRWK